MPAAQPGSSETRRIPAIARRSAAARAPAADESLRCARVVGRNSTRWSPMLVSNGGGVR